MAGDRRVGRVGQAELLQAGAALRLRAVVERAAREEAVDQRRLDVGARELGAQRAADELAAAAEDGDRQRRLAAVAEQALLGRAAARRQGAQLPGVERACPAAPRRSRTWWASARSMLSPPSRM